MQLRTCLLIRGNTKPNMYLSMFDISKYLRYGELNVFYVSERLDRKYAPAAHGIDLMVLYVWCAEAAIRTLTTLLMYERAHKGTPSQGFTLLLRT